MYVSFVNSSRWLIDVTGLLAKNRFIKFTWNAIRVLMMLANVFGRLKKQLTYYSLSKPATHGAIAFSKYGEKEGGRHYFVARTLIVSISIKVEI